MGVESAVLPSAIALVERVILEQGETPALAGPS
jgi:hypothetical protein